MPAAFLGEQTTSASATIGSHSPDKPCAKRHPANTNHKYSTAPVAMHATDIQNIRLVSLGTGNAAGTYSLPGSDPSRTESGSRISKRIREPYKVGAPTLRTALQYLRADSNSSPTIASHTPNLPDAPPHAPRQMWSSDDARSLDLAVLTIPTFHNASRSNSIPDVPPAPHTVHCWHQSAERKRLDRRCDT